MTPSEIPSHDDPAEVLAGVVDDDVLADDLAVYLTCVEVNVLTGLLDAAGHHDGADY